LAGRRVVLKVDHFFSMVCNWVVEGEDPKVTEYLKKMTPEQKLRTAAKMYFTAREWKAAGLRSFHPDWSEEQVQEEVKRVFRSART
jgi:hypothetical protein